MENIIARHATTNEARVAANKALVERAIRIGLVRDKILTKKDPDIPVSTYILVRNKSPLKFRPK